jgi:hypothetical protein
MDNPHRETTGNSGVGIHAVRELLREIGRILSEEAEAIQEAEAMQNTFAETPVAKPHPDNGEHRATIASEFSGQKEARGRGRKMRRQPFAEGAEFFCNQDAGTNRKVISEAFATVDARITALLTSR